MIISMPLYFDMGISRRTKKPNRYYINLNNYHTWHFQVRNKLKIKYKEVLALKVKDVVLGKKTALNFILHRGDKRKVDRANILSIHEKFFCDGLVECGCIKDDDDSYIESTHYYTGAIDKENPRVDIELVEWRD